MSAIFYAAYGSNLNKTQMKQRCPTAKPIAKTLLKDYVLEFRGSANNAHATVTPCAGHSVPIVIWQITENDEKSLDRYEGVSGGYYTKEYIDVEVKGRTKHALIYIMTQNDFGIPSLRYYGTIDRGYKDFGFDEKILKDALSRSVQGMYVYETGSL